MTGLSIHFVNAKITHIRRITDLIITIRADALPPS